MCWLDVSDQSGNYLGKVRVGDTKHDVVERLGRGPGGLFDKDCKGLLNGERITADGAPYTFRAQQDSASAYIVTGAISRQSSHAMARYYLFKWAVEHSGLYPQGLNKNTSFAAKDSEGDGDRRVLFFSVAFLEEKLAVKFLAQIDKYVSDNSDLYFCTENGEATDRPNVQPIPSFPIHSYVFPSDYVPQKGEAVPPLDSPVVDMSIGLRSTSSPSETTVVSILAETDDVFNLQRIENEGAFVLSVAESAHIFPRAKCAENQKYKWLNEPDFNRLALSRDFQANYDGLGRGRGKRPRTVQQLTLRPVRPATGFSLKTLELRGTEQYFEIPLQLFFKDNSKAEQWMQRLPNEAVLNRPRDERCYASGLKIYCLASRKITLMFESVQQPDGSMENELLTAVPGIENLDDCWSIERNGNVATLLVAEIMEKCLQWNYQEALRMWAQVG